MLIDICKSWFKIQLCLLKGFNVNQRRKRKSSIGFQHRVTKEESMKWFQQKVSFPSFYVRWLVETSFSYGMKVNGS